MTIFRSLRLLLISLAFTFSVTQAQTPATATTILTATALQKDIVLLRQAYESLHPGLYRYSSKPEMDAKFDELATRLNKRWAKRRQDYRGRKALQGQSFCVDRFE